jgi:hypothetical protein
MSVWKIITLVALILVLGCSSHEELPPPDNPFDPGNPDYQSPSVVIISGPTENEIVEVTSVTFEWQGNESATEYSYQIDNSVWSEWSTGTSEEFDYLDEGDHMFRVQARSINGDAQETPTTLTFGVNAVEGPSTVVYPYKESVSPGDTIVYQIIAEEVSDLFAIGCNISIDADRLELIEVVGGDILGEWGGEALYIQEVSDSIITLSAVAVEGLSTSFSGTTSILSLVVRIKPTAVLTSIFTAVEISDITYLNPDIEAIDIAIKRSGVLVGY